MNQQLLLDRFNYLLKAKPVPFGTFLLCAIFLGALVWAIIHFMRKGNKYEKKDYLFLIGCALAVIPVSLMGLKFTIQDLNITDIFRSSYFFIGFFQMALIVVVLGRLGHIPAFCVGLVIGFVQLILYNQDITLIVVYAAFPVVLLIILILPNMNRSLRIGQRKWISVFLAWLCLLLPIAILICTRALFLRLPFGWFLIKYALFIWMSLIPAMFIGTGALWLFQSKYFVHWRLEEFVRIPNSLDELKPAIEQIRLLSTGNFDMELLTKANSPQERALFQAIENLRKNLQFRHEAQTRLLSLDPSHYSKEGYDLILSSVLRAALTRDASTARLLLVERNTQTDIYAIRSRFGQGEKTRLYAYLDAMILDKLGRQNQLILTDIKLDHYFGLSAGTPFPQSVIALPLNDKGHLHGVLWIGFDQKKWFSPEDIKFYHELAFRASVAIATKLETQLLIADKASTESGLNAIPHAVFILNDEHIISFMNEKGKALARKVKGLLESDEGNYRFSHTRIIELLDRQSELNVFNSGVVLDNGDIFDIELYPINPDKESKALVVFMIDQAWLSQMNRQRTEFISNISHDLRSPLKMIKGHLILIKRMGNLNKEQQGYIKSIEEYAENMSRLVNKMLSLEKLDSENSIDYSRFDFKQKLEEVVRLLSPIAQQNKVEIKTEYKNMPSPYISADAILLPQALYNLIENAVKYSQKGGVVTIVVEKDASWLHIIVQDKGRGIAPLDQPMLFDRFFYVNDESGIENSVQGLGLAIVKSIVDKHDGNVRVESRLGEGSRFFIDIPVHNLS